MANSQLKVLAQTQLIGKHSFQVSKILKFSDFPDVLHLTKLVAFNTRYPIIAAE